MPISAGEVEAVLSARDIMSPVMIQAAERVKSLEVQLKALGATSGATFDDLNTRLQAAQANFDSLAQLNSGAVQAALARTQAGLQQTAVNAQTLGTATAATNTALAATAPAAANAAAGLAQTAAGATSAGQSMGQVEGIAMRLVERMLILYAVRGTFQFVVGIYEAADALNKLSMATDLSLGKLQVLQYGAELTGIPFTKVTTAIDNLDKKLAENKMVTQDALESIGLSFAAVFALKPDERFDAIVAAIGNLPDKLSRTRAEVALFGSDAIDPMITRYKELGEEAKKSNTIMSDDTVRTLAIAAESYRLAGVKIKAEAGGLFAWLIEEEGKAFTSLANLLTGDPSNPSIKPHDIPLPRDNSSANFSSMSVPPDYIEQLKAAAAGVHALTDEQVKQLLELKELNLLTEDNAAKLTHQGVNIGLNTEQYKRFTAAMKDMSDIDKAAERYAQAWERATKQTEQLWDKDIEALNKKVKVEAQITDDQAKLRASQDTKENADRLARGAITDTQYFAAKAAIEYKYWQQHNDTLKANEVFELNQLKSKEDSEMAALEAQFARGLIDESQYQEDRKAIADRYAAERLTIEEKFNSDMDIRRRVEIDKEIADRKAALAQIAKDKAKAEAEDAKAKKANLDMGGSMDINRGNLDQNAAYWGIPASAAEAMAMRGMSFQEIVSAWQSGTVDKWIPHGPRIPGFFEGGMVDIKVGEHGPETIRAPLGSQVAPSGSGFGNGVTVNMAVNGMLDPATIRQIAAAVSESIMRESKKSLQYVSR